MITVRFRSFEALYSAQITAEQYDHMYQVHVLALRLVLRGLPFRRTRDYVHSHPLEGDCLAERGTHICPMSRVQKDNYLPFATVWVIPDWILLMLNKK